MYFLWKRTPHGNIRVSCDGFSDFVNRILSGKSRCRGLSVVEGDTAAMTLVLSSTNNAAIGCSDIEKRLTEIMSPLGFSVQVIWTDNGTPGADLGEYFTAAYQNPWTWMLLTSLVAMRVIAGWHGLFWIMFWGTSAWFVSKIVISLVKKKKLGAPPPLIRR